jgi:hypothetical protein
VCGKTLGIVLLNGRTLSISGGAGNDVLFGSDPAIEVNGDNDSDIVTGSNANVHLNGGLGDDDVEAWGTGSLESLIGDLLVPGPSDGNDCLWDKSKRADTVVCDRGSDSVNDVVASGHTAGDCENVSPTVCCNWAHFAGGC